jgi:leader peptidase (prepilin peptidase)/N-methyltransferase
VITLVPLIPLAYFGLQLSVIDFNTHRLPNRLVGQFLGVEVCLCGVISWITSDFARVGHALIAAAATFSVYVALYLLSRGSLGMGDVKFAFPLGLCIGWYSAEKWLVTIYVTFLLAGLVVAIGLVSKRMSRKSKLAFGPYMFICTFLVCCFEILPQ